MRWTQRSTPESPHAKFPGDTAFRPLIPTLGNYAGGYAIVRETGFRRHEILMLHRDPEDVIPMARTIWTVTCPNPATRDRLLRWLQDRMDRWTGWGEMAMDHCAHAPSQHVLALVMQDPGMARPTVGLPTEGLTADRPPLR